MLELFDELALRCPLSCSGSPPALTLSSVPRIVERRHERACHGDGHVLVFDQSCCEFEADGRPACAAIEVTGKRPVGYRAPTFGLNAISRGGRRRWPRGFGHDSRPWTLS